MQVGKYFYVGMNATEKAEQKRAQVTHGQEASGGKPVKGGEGEGRGGGGGGGEGCLR